MGGESYGRWERHEPEAGGTKEARLAGCECEKRMPCGLCEFCEAREILLPALARQVHQFHKDERLIPQDGAVSALPMIQRQPPAFVFLSLYLQDSTLGNT